MAPTRTYKPLLPRPKAGQHVRALAHTSKHVPKHPETSRHVQARPDMLRHLQTRPNTPKHVHTRPHTDRSGPARPNMARHIPTRPGTSRHAPTRPNTAKHFQTRPDTPRHVQKHPNTSLRGPTQPDTRPDAAKHVPARANTSRPALSKHVEATFRHMQTRPDTSRHLQTQADTFIRSSTSTHVQKHYYTVVRLSPRLRLALFWSQKRFPNDDAARHQATSQACAGALFPTESGPARLKIAARPPNDFAGNEFPSNLFAPPIEPLFVEAPRRPTGGMVKPTRISCNLDTA